MGKRIRKFWKRATGLFGRTRAEQEMLAELESHLAMHTDDNIRRGMSPEEARRMAVLALGGIEPVKEAWRDQRGLPVLDRCLQDVRYAVRGMRRSPGFAAAAVLSLALGIGGCTAIFGIVNATLLRPLPYRQPERLATISLGGAISAPYFLTFQNEARSIEQAALFVNCWFDLTGSHEPERIPAARVSAELFDVLGVRPELGRTFTRKEDRAGGEAVVLISHRLWRSRFGADPGIVGRTVRLSGAPYTIIGVMPEGFHFPDGPELPVWAGWFPAAEMWHPLALLDWERTDAGSMNFAMIARLRGGITADTARMELTELSERIQARRRDPLVVRTLRQAVTDDTRAPVLILAGAVAVALLIACVNVANLLLARGLRRRHEIAVRISLGASRRRVLGQLLTEALVLALCAGVLAIPLAAAAVGGLAAMAPLQLAGAQNASVDPRMLLFALAIVIGVTAVFGVVPSFQIAWHTPGDVMKAQGRSATAAPSRTRRVLVAAEFGLALVLLVAAGLLVKSFAQIVRTPLGLRTEHVLTARTSLPDTKYKEERRAALIGQLAERCAGLPGVISAGAVSTLPLTGEAEGWGTVAEDNPNPKAYTQARVRAITPTYFQTMGIRLEAGREFTSGDDGRTPVVIVSREAARKLWPGVENPLGRRLRNRRMIVVGIVGDTRASGLDKEIRPYLYLPFSQFAPEDFALVLRSEGNPLDLAGAVKSELWRIDKDQPLTHVTRMEDLAADSLASRRYPSVVMALFAGFALVLAAVGIYGVISYSVEQRRQEIGIRMALGASPASVLRDSLRESAVVVGVGGAAGLALSFLLTPLLRQLLYGVRVDDAGVFAAAAGLLVAVALGASVVPALRAAAVDPLVALRHE